VARKAPGWVAVGMVGAHTGQTVLDNEIVLANVDSGEVCRVAHARTFAGSTSEGRWGYWSETHVVLSPTGTRVLFASDWRGGPTVRHLRGGPAEAPALRALVAYLKARA